ncbi:hypothetical protein GLOTRDRAFT_132219 [Gloeophyllum trabeum ATCC 11539]|uniref:RING-type domain-containing protein n=1 Tax=Gloeophyllum trabeum (strain ATCC 11539 / FP-39264 / Madison 617) TaxID=670483 RepID=S7RD20_GLOTA|nr:uncharacterized protein GLOTRDRAFT_132219 [Gloeophyllum trabeum ATCC 11539]EPQ52100.1 hypothetical protein GLOTRDRAFT_132219 [Gloeophyllum trabeum ATCC 11539]
MAQGRVDVTLLPNLPAAGEKEQKEGSTLFGPNIGIVSTGPAWTEQPSRKSAADDLTPEVIRSWVEKSKQTSQPTTTLQALVNLKRPTIRLTPFKDESSDDPTHLDPEHHHGLEFEYDCDAPKCGIYVYVVLPSDHPLANEKNTEDGFARVLVFESVTEGGFGKFLKHEDGAMLELARFENGGATDTNATSPAEDPSASSVDVQGQSAPPAEADITSARSTERKRRFSAFPFRKRHAQRAVAGPALAVVDAQPAAPTVPDTPDAEPSENKELAHGSDASDNEGVRVAIKLVALDEQGKPLDIANEQVTYLHIVRFGAPPVKVDDLPAEEDKRPWVVKVVKREATIGSHTFHLHEIYGLSSYSSTPSQPVAPTASPTTHTYPPAPAPGSYEDEPSSECLVCLSSPREVVLLPCRHLVACKECAINMVEFGAGGAIVHNEESTGNTESAAASGDGSAGDGAPGAPVSEAAAPQPTPRRKRKAKGWFCPVCRQPYTSLLRITTAPPASKDMDKRASTSTEGGDTPAETSPSIPAALPPAAAAPASRGSLITAPAFLRNISFRGNNAASPTLPPDLERGQGPQTAAPASAA